MNKLNNGRLAKRAEDEEIAKDEAFIAAAFRYFLKHFFITKKIC